MTKGLAAARAGPASAMSSTNVLTAYVLQARVRVRARVRGWVRLSLLTRTRARAPSPCLTADMPQAIYPLTPGEPHPGRAGGAARAVRRYGHHRLHLAHPAVQGQGEAAAAARESSPPVYAPRGLVAPDYLSAYWASRGPNTTYCLFLVVVNAFTHVRACPLCSASCAVTYLLTVQRARG